MDRSRYGRWSYLWAGMAWMALCLLAPGQSAPPSPRSVSEAQLKAVFLFNIAQFVRWPEAPNLVDAPSFRIGVLDASQLHPAFTELTNQQVHGRRLALIPITTVPEATTCEMVYLNGSDTHLIRRLLKSVTGRPILTLGDDPAFLQWGGIMRFRMVGERLRLEASPRHAAHAGLTLSAQLLEVCLLMDETPSAAPPAAAPLRREPP